MCGIAGYITTNKLLNASTLETFIQCQKHRGPDSSGVFAGEGIGLAHTRLSILDTSNRADQPFTSANGRYVMVYNGEVYNFKDLSKQLHVNLSTTSDTEVIIELFAEQGAKCVEKFRGMFSIVIYDKEEDSLYIFRDRFGIKPLYYYQSGDSFIFSSELKAIAELNEVRDKLTVNQESINHFLHLGFVPSTSTIFNEIHSFPSGSYGKITKELKLNTTVYWKVSDYLNYEKTSFSSAKAKIKDLLFSSVQEHLVSDVPVGLFLSGGIDSSLLAAISSQLLPNKLKTFTIGMEGKHDEAPFAKKIAAYLGTDHYEAYLGEKNATDLLEHINSTYDEPFADTSSIPTMFVSELASKHVKVALSGEGADEIFLGYNSYNWANRINHPLLRFSKVPVQILSKFITDPRLIKLERMLSKSGSPYQSSEIYSTEHGFYSTRQIETIRNTSYKGFDYLKNPSSIKDQIQFELEISLKNGLLVKMDRATMKYGLEARIPFLDHRLVEYALSLNLEHTFSPNKHILKELLFEMIPSSFFNRKKWGFGLSSNHIIKDHIEQKLRSKKREANNLPRLFASYILENNKFLPKTV